MVDRSPSEEIELLRHQLQEACARSELRRILLEEARAFIFETSGERDRARVHRSVKVKEALERYQAHNKNSTAQRVCAEQNSWSWSDLQQVMMSILTRSASQTCENRLRSTKLNETGCFRRTDLEREILHKAKRRAEGIEAVILEAAKSNPKLGEANWRLAGIICGRSDRDDAVAAAEWAARLFADCLIIEGEV